MSGKKRKQVQIDRLAIVAVLLSVIGFAIYIQPQPTGDVYEEQLMYRLEDLTAKEVRAPNIPLGVCRDSNDAPTFVEADLHLIDLGYVTHKYLCAEVSLFSFRSLPLAGVFWLGAVLILLLRLKPVRAR
jgi:hypothetical protein